jgi:hypothetical protein
MKLESADKITSIWARYIQDTHPKLLYVFGVDIPESFLPFPIKTLEDAINIQAEYWHDLGVPKEKIVMLQSTIGIFSCYRNDEDALLEAVKLINNEELRKKILPRFKKFQQEWVRKQGI